MTRSDWPKELWLIAGLFALWAIAGLITGAYAGAAAGLIALYLARHAIPLLKLLRWIRSPDQAALPDGFGVWSDVFTGLYRRETRNQRMQRHLETVIRRFEEASDALPDAAVLADENGRIEWFNAVARDLLGLEASTDIGQQITQILRNPHFVDLWEQQDPEARADMDAPDDSGRLLLVRVLPFTSKRRLVVARDITRQTQLEAMRRDFVANVSHEIRTPLTVLTGFLESLVDDPNPDVEAWRGYLHTMQEQGQRMARMVEDLLLLSRLEREDGAIATDELVPVPQLLEEIGEEARRISGDRNHRIIVDVAPDLNLRGHPTHLRSAFSNLVFNAVQYTPPGGEIRIRWYPDSRGAHLQVIDSGIGIPQKDIARLTERFYRVDPGRSRAQGGTGLGLAIVKHALSHHQATLTIDSSPDKGSTFGCHFPRDRMVRGEQPVSAGT